MKWWNMHPDFADVFLEEADEMLARIESCSLALRTGEAGPEVIAQLFRALHTLKGSGAMCGFTQVAAFAHEVETLLDLVRAGTIPVSHTLADLMIASGDHIRLLIQADQGGPAIDDAVHQQLLARVFALAGEGAESTPVQDVLPRWRICFRPDRDLLVKGGNPDLLLKDLRDLGQCEVRCDTRHVPELAGLAAEQCYLQWSIDLRTSASLAQIEEVFLFVRDGSELAIERVDEGGAGRPEEPTGQAAAAPSVEAKASEAPAERRVAGAATSREAPAREATVRVPASRLDRLVNLVGELVMNQSRLATAAARLRAAELAAPVEEIERLVSELRDDVLQIRMMPIGSIFGRFRRLVHDLSVQLGKEIDLVTEGEETELDKGILDQLGDPLVHLLRNSIDHGIESADKRVAAGKPRRGRLVLSATHRGSDVVVSISDDGGGLNREAIRAKAVARQLIGAEANLSDKELLHLILLPGFSTAAQVTDVSGRGVGMDAVKRQIDALRGSLTLASEPGQGTTFTITLPLTLAIIEGLLVETGDSNYIIPMAAVAENVELTEADRRLYNGRNLVAVRGQLVPYVDLREAFAIPGERPAISKIVLVQHEDQRVGLVVDRVLGTHQTVIQALGRFFRKIEVVSGCTVMGDGRVALVLDIAGVVRTANLPPASHPILRVA
jgi:two-component system, chemotaxis family, sensor kinase CheA